MRFAIVGRRPLGGPPPSDRPDWAQADPRRIDAASERARELPGGGWAVLDASRRITDRPRAFRVAGVDLVAWRGPSGAVRVGPDACPHMGASLCQGRVDEAGRVVCPWHGLALGERAHGGWTPRRAHDDGVLVWVREPSLCGPSDPPTDRPTITPRPARFVDGVVRLEARCAPRDVLANRLDPWHGVHFHPHAFLRLRVIDEDLDQVTVRVVYRAAPGVGVEVDARFACPDPRTVAMTIVEGEGLGSVVETHATPMDEGRTAIVEATLAASDRPGFRAARLAGWGLRPFIERRARALWVEDRAYAERRYALRRGEEG